MKILSINKQNLSLNRRAGCGRQVLATLAVAVVLASTVVGSADASVFSNSSRWPTASDGVTKIPVCIEPKSSTKQKADGAARGLIHSRNPTLDDVVARVQRALANSWEKWSSVDFYDWRMCDKLSPSWRSQYVGVWIHPDAPNNSHVGTNARGGTTNFKPWGNSFNRCINYNWWSTHAEYSYRCVEQYAIHEFGHVLGFQHEWRHPLVPPNCADRNPLDANRFAHHYPNRAGNTIVNPQYDFDSIMTYTGGCVDKDGVRFGSTNLSPADIIGVSTIYPPRAGLGPDACNPGWFDAERWYCEANPDQSAGNSCTSPWLQCTPGCNPGVFGGDYWSCPNEPYLTTGQSCSAGWRRCESR